MTVAALPPISVGSAHTPRVPRSAIGDFLAGTPMPSRVWGAQTARRIPSVARALQLFGGMCKQMPLDLYRGDVPLPRPPLLTRPDPFRARSWFVQVHVEDYLLHGNAVSLVTSRSTTGWPLAVTWLPSAWVSLTWLPWDEESVTYWYAGSPLPKDDVIHVRRGADPYFPVRGVGIIEEQLDTLDRVAMEDDYERNALAGGAVPSVAIITPSAVLTQGVAEEAKDAWMAKFGGPTREPAILPAGTQVVPLAWSPSDTQLIEARRQSLVDVANMWNLDGYWLGAPVAGMTYRTAGPQYQQILRTSLEPVLADFEDIWSDAWLPRGQQLRFDRNQLLRDDISTTAQALVMLVGAGIMTPDEAKAYLALPTVSGGQVGKPNTVEDGGDDSGDGGALQPGAPQ